jgi:hypothetical protein
LQEIHTITDTFTSVLVGIYHQRIEYPQTADISRATPLPAEERPAKAPGTITLELLRSEVRPQERQRVNAAAMPDADEPAVAERAASPDELVADYEAVDYLPRGD